MIESLIPLGPPRLFPTKAGANVALKLWLKGDWIGKKSNRTWDPITGIYLGNPGFHAEFANPRTHLIDDMEVIPVDVVPHYQPPATVSLLSEELYP